MCGDIRGVHGALHNTGADRDRHPETRPQVRVQHGHGGVVGGNGQTPHLHRHIRLSEQLAGLQGGGETADIAVWVLLRASRSLLFVQQPSVHQSLLVRPDLLLRSHAVQSCGDGGFIPVHI